MSGPGGEAAIDRASVTPYYLQLADRIRDQISAGTIAVGERLPSEGELASSWNLSRATVREALRLLEEHGWVSRIARRGAFASIPPQRGWLLHGREGFFEDESRRHHVTTEVLRAEQTLLPRLAAEALPLQPGSEGYVLERLRELDGKIALYSINYLPSRIGRVVALSDVPAGAGSLNTTLHQAGYEVAGASRTVEAVAADGSVAKRQQVSTGAPLLKIKSTCWNSNLVAFDHHEVWVRSDVVHVEIQVGSPGPAHQQSPTPAVGRLVSP
jgi:GntR family transcriptional regulator